MRVLEPHSVTIITTDKCTAECRHCCMNSGPDRQHRLSYAQIESALTQMFAAFDMKVVVFAGGEPTLLGKDLLDAIALCKRHGVVSRVVTNAYWAHSPEAAYAKCKELRDAGLDEFNVSMDDYHAPFIAFERVKHAYEAAMKLDFSAVVIANCHGPESVLTPEYLESHFGMSGVPIQRRFDVDGNSVVYQRQENGKIVVLSNGMVQRLGRGQDLIDDDECLDDAATTDVGAELVGGCPWAARQPSITPRNHFVACCGFELQGNPILDYGDASQGIAALADKADNDLITNMIAMLGPPKLMSLLKELCPDEINFPRQRYHSYCEVCQDLVGIEKNRRALYKHQGMFAELVLDVRDQMRDRFRTPSGRIEATPIRLPGVKIVPPDPPATPVDGERR